MKKQRAEFHLTIDGRKFEVWADKFQIGKNPQVHVCLNPHEKNSQVYNFYETAPKEFKWFELQDKKQLTAIAIAKKLKSVTFN